MHSVLSWYINSYQWQIMFIKFRIDQSFSNRNPYKSRLRDIAPELVFQIWQLGLERKSISKDLSTFITWGKGAVNGHPTTWLDAFRIVITITPTILVPQKPDLYLCCGISECFFVLASRNSCLCTNWVRQNFGIYNTHSAKLTGLKI